MPTVDRAPLWSDLADHQHGILSRGQLLELGFSSAAARTNISNGRWRVLLPGVYASFTGAVPPLASIWAAVLYAGPGAAASHRTALWLSNVVDELVDPIHVCVPASRRVRRQVGIHIHLTRRLDDPRLAVLHPSSAPPRVRLEVALLDQCEYETAEQAAHFVLTAIQRRLTTADRLGRALASRSRHRWRGLLRQILDEAKDGVASPLELQYRRIVEAAHQLPAGLRNRREVSPIGGSWYRDVRYPRWHVVVELDGREAHPVHRAFRDYRRDNRAALAKETVLRYGWRDVIGNPYDVAAQVAQILAFGGWQGQPSPCSSGYTALAAFGQWPEM